MHRAPALIFAGLAVAGIVVALIKGDAAAGEGISRENDPMAFWGLMFVYAALALIMLYIAWTATA